MPEPGQLLTPRTRSSRFRAIGRHGRACTHSAHAQQPRCFGPPPCTWSPQDLGREPWTGGEPADEPTGTKEKDPGLRSRSRPRPSALCSPPRRGVLVAPSEGRLGGSWEGDAARAAGRDSVRAPAQLHRRAAQDEPKEDPRCHRLMYWTHRPRPRHDHASGPFASSGRMQSTVHPCRDPRPDRGGLLRVPLRGGGSARQLRPPGRVPGSGSHLLVHRAAGLLPEAG